MKTIYLFLILAIIALLNNSINAKAKSKNSNKKSRKSKVKKQTPKGLDLRNHYGTPNVGSQYGPAIDYSNHVESNPDVYTPQRFAKTNNVADELKFKPYPGYQLKLNPHKIKSGDFTNIAPSASSVINPEITGPKVHLQAEIEYPSNVKVPNFYGFKNEFKDVSAYDRLDNQIVEDRVLVNHPIYGYGDKVIFYVWINFII